MAEIEFVRRPRVARNDAMILRRYRARVEPYSVVFVQSPFRWRSSDGKRTKLADRWLAIYRLPNGNEYVISRHRGRRGAERACEEHQNHLTTEPTTA